jgi:hypothetical protein
LKLLNLFVGPQLKAAAKLPPNSIKPLLVEDQPDTFVKPINFDELPIG